MAERLNITPEKAEPGETLLALPTPEKAEPLRRGEADPREALEKARASVAETNRAEKTQPNPLEKLRAAETAAQPMAPRQINRELKRLTLQRELLQIRRKLSLPQRTLSKVIHQPVVRLLSETADHTVSRPSGLLGGGLLAFAGTSFYLYLARHNGFRYNYLVFLLLLVAGFILGLLLELLVHLVMNPRRRLD